jgi:hypothetical protein
MHSYKEHNFKFYVRDVRHLILYIIWATSTSHKTDKPWLRKEVGGGGVVCLHLRLTLVSFASLHCATSPVWMEDAVTASSLDHVQNCFSLLYILYL